MTRDRWIVIAAWIVLAVVLVLVAPGAGRGGGFGSLLPKDSSAVRAQERSLRDFAVPVLAGTTVVVHQRGGLSLLTRADSLLWALSTTQQAQSSSAPDGPNHIVAAIPVPTGRSDLTVTYLYTSPGTSARSTVRLADQYAAHFNNQPSTRTYVTGFVPAQVAQGGYLESRLALFEAASVLLILLVVAVAFRSLLAPVVIIAIAAIGYAVYFPLLNIFSAIVGIDVSAQLKPVLVALLLGVVTDYCVLFFAAYRHELETTSDSVEAVRRVVRRDSPVIAVAGIAVAGGTLALLAAPFEIFRALGPALALSVLVGLAVGLMLAPAAMTILGARLFTVLPFSKRSPESSTRPDPARRTAADRPKARASRAGLRIDELMARLSDRTPAAAATAIIVVLLALCCVPLTQARLSLSFTAGLPSDDSAAVGARLLETSGLRGISAPTEVLLEQPGITSRRLGVDTMQGELAKQPGVVRVLGPADSPLSQPYGLVMADSGNAARFIVIYDTDPLAAEAIAHVRRLRTDLSEMATRVGLAQARSQVTGQTVIASSVARLTRHSLEVTLVTALVIELALLVVFLRSLVAPVVLLACSALSVAAALGLTTLLFQGVLGQEGLTFYAPFAAAVLLIALGSDYNVFMVGSIWQEAERLPLRKALAAAVPRTARAVTTAGVILAATFAMVAVIPLSTFRQIAFAMGVGLLLDTVVVRPFLTPAVLTLLGPLASWPGSRIRTEETP